ncbi:MAG: hypothetical protein HUU32_11855 [Calditrichaceae bacterium]|nr:hypothetical protein [Calditrichia bacterium]NUQ42083.1 hypothetical protein [Calditrichaceae bacterium]
MEEILIRQTTAADLEGVAKLWHPRRRDPDIFRWLLADSHGRLRSFVAVSGEKIVGHIGYIISDYRFNGASYKGVFTIEWLVDEASGKQAALPLYSKVLKMGDFTFVIGGTEVVWKIYPLLKFKTPLQVSRFLKVTRPLPYLKALNHDPLRKIVKTAFYSRGLLLRKPLPANGELALVPYDGNAPILPGSDLAVANETQKEHIEWLMKVPGVDAYPFTLRKDGKPAGTALCYVQEIEGVVCGRIVHVSYLGKEVGFWRQVLRQLEQFLTQKGCCIITTLASDPHFVQALKQNGHFVFRESPFWLRDPKGRFEGASWHLTYLEGDLAYRDMYMYDFVPPKKINSVLVL